MKFNSMDDIAAAFVEATTIETGALFVQGQIILEAANEGWDIDETCAYCAVQVKRSKRTAYRRYSVARTFGKPHPALPFEHHAICSDLVDYRSKDAALIARQQENAREWLQRAVTEDMSTRALEAAIRAAGGRVDVKPTVYVDGLTARLNGCLEGEYGGYAVELMFEDVFDLPPDGTPVKVYLVQALAETTEAGA